MNILLQQLPQSGYVSLVVLSVAQQNRGTGCRFTMPATSFKEYRPGVAPYARRITAAEWGEHRELLTSLHNQHLSRRRILEVLADHDFRPSKGQLVSKMMQWGLMVSLEPSNQSSLPNSIHTTVTARSYETCLSVLQEAQVGSLESLRTDIEDRGLGSLYEAEGTRSCERNDGDGSGIVPIGDTAIPSPDTSKTLSQSYSAPACGESEMLFPQSILGWANTARVSPDIRVSPDTFPKVDRDATFSRHEQSQPTSDSGIVSIPRSIGKALRDSGVIFGHCTNCSGPCTIHSGLDSTRFRRHILAAIYSSYRGLLGIPRRWPCDCDIFITIDCATV